MVKTNIQTFTGEVEVLEEFYVGSNLVANDVATHVLTVNNSANDAKIKSDFFVGDGGLLSNIATTLQSIADQGNAASNVILFNSNTDVAGYKNVGFVTTSNVGIQNTAPTHTMSIGDKIIIDNNTDESQGESVMLVHGRISADRFQGDGGLLSNIATTLESIADQGNASSNVLIFNSNIDIPGYRGVGFVTTSNVGIQNTNPGFNTLSIGSNLFVNIYGSNVLTVHGNAAVSNLLVSDFSVSPAHGLQDVTQEGRATNQTVQLTNTTTGLEVSSNINVAGEVILTNATKGLDVTSNIEIGGRLKFDTNVFVDTLRVADVAANIVTYDRSTGELLDSSGTFMNKFAVVSEQPPSDLFANATTVTNHGGYTLTTSNLATNSNTYNAFDGTANAWVSGDLAGGYIGGANVFHENNLTQLSNLHPTQFGDWLAIEFPYKTTLRHMKLTPLTAAQFPARANVYATNDNHTWSEVKYWGSVTDTSLDVNPVTASNVQTIVVNATEQFKKYALVATKAAGDSSNVALQDWQLFTESFSIDGGKVAMAQQAVTGGETVMDQSGPHRRNPTTPLLKKFPEIVFEEGKFDKNDSTNTYVQAGYTVSASSQVYLSTFKPWNTFDGNIGNEGWHTSLSSNGPDSFTGTVGGANSYNGTSSLGGISGAWLKLELPHKIRLSSIDLLPRDYTDQQEPKDFKILGSNDDTNWVELIDVVGATWTQGVSRSFSVTGEVQAYKYLAISVSRVVGTTVVILSDLKYYGYEEDPPLGDTSVDTTFTSIMNTPQTTGANVYVDGNLGETFTNRVTGPDATGTATTYNETGKYWELTGALTSNVSLEANTFLEGDQPHAVSVWFNSSNLEANVSNTCVFSISDQEKLDSVNLDLQSNTWHNLTYAYQGEGGSRVTYLDGRKVAEDQAEDTFGDYPPFAMTGYSQGGYVVSARTEYDTAGSNAVKAFDDNTGTAYRPVNSAYDGSGNLDSGGTFAISGSATTPGEWIKMEMPHKLVVSYLFMQSVATSTGPSDFKLFGSNDDVNWDELLSVIGQTTATAGTSNPVNASNGYKYLAVVVTKTLSSQDLQIGEIKFYGHRENDLVRLPDPTNVLKYPHIAFPNSDGPAGQGPNATTSIRGYVATSDDPNPTFYPIGKVFDGIFSDPAGGNANNQARWQPATAIYANGNDTTSGATTTLANGTTYKGNYMQLESPHKLNVTKYKIYSGTFLAGYRPIKVVMLGSNTGGSDWVDLGSGETTLTYSGTNATYAATVSISNTATYKYHRLVIRAVHTNNLPVVYQLELYGTGVDSIPIQIGGGNIDKVANFRVYDKFVGEDQALEIWDAQKDAFGRAKSSMTLQKGRLGLGTTEPEGRLAVLDEPHNLEEFPPRGIPSVGPITADNSKVYIDGHGTYEVLYSVDKPSHFNNATDNPLVLFDKTFNNLYSEIDSFGLNSAGATGSAVGSGNPLADPAIYTGNASGRRSLGGYGGIWYGLKFPFKVNLSRAHILPPENVTVTPNTAIFLGSEDGGLTWSKIGEFSGASWASHSYNKYTLSHTKPINAAAIVITHSNHYYAANMAEMKFFGTREQGQSVLHDGQLTLTKNLTVPRMGPALDADDTPRRDRLVVEYNTSTNPTFEGVVRDTSGRGLDGILHSSVSYEADGKSFQSFGGGGLETMATNNLLPTNGTHTFSAWIRFDTSGTWYAVYGVGGNVTFSGNNSITVYIGSGVFRLESRGGSYRDYGYTFKHGKWVHMAVVYDGTGGYDNFDIYMDTVKLSQGSASSNGTTAITLPTENQTVRFGSSAESSPGAASSSYLLGAMSSVKFYDTVLTFEEVKTLYQMGRCDEGHHVVNFSKTRVGIGLGDGEAPRGALDVRGDIHGGCPAFWNVYNSASKSGSGYVLFNTVRNNCIKNVSLDGTTGKITIQVAGWYKLDVHGMSYEIVGTTGADTASVGRFAINDATFSSYIYTRMGIPSGVGVHANVSGQSVHYLNVGDLVGYKLTGDTNNSFYGNGYSSFSGFLLSM